MVHAAQGANPLANGGETLVLHGFVWLYFVAAGPRPWSVDAAMKRG